MVGTLSIYGCPMCRLAIMTVALNTGKSRSNMDCPQCGMTAYVLEKGTIAGACLVTHAWYRPKPEAVPPEETTHVLAGGLIVGPLSDVERQPEPKKLTREWLIKHYSCSGYAAQ